jgi:CRISPR-associated protein Cas1
VIIRERVAWLDKPIQSPRTGKRLKWRGMIEEDILSFARYVTGDGDHAPYRDY